MNHFCAILLAVGAANALVTMPLVHRPKSLQKLRKDSAKLAGPGRSAKFAAPEGSAAWCDYSKKSSVDVPFLDSLDGMYYGKVQVGTPPQDFLLLVDPNSGWLWVPKVGCENCDDPRAPGNFDHYDSSLSSTWVSRPDLGPFDSRDMYYGTYGNETVIMGDMTIENQIFGEVVWRCIAAFEGAPFDGMLGLGPSPLANGIPNVVHNLFSQGKIKHNVFGIFLDHGEKDGSVLSIGGTQKSLYTEDFFYIPLSAVYSLEPMWLVDGDDFKLDGTSTDYCKSSNGCLFLVDAAASFVFLAPEYGMAVMDKVGVVDVNCSNRFDMPTLSFTINGRDFSMEPLYYNVPVILDDSGEPQCYTFVQASNDGFNSQFGSNFIALCDPFLKKYYSVYDYDRMRVGLAPAIWTKDSKTAGLQTDTQMLFM